MVVARPSLGLLAALSISAAAPLLAQKATDHWAFRSPGAAVEEPYVRDGSWRRDPIDAFVLARLEAEGLAPSAEAEPRTLLRRLHLDLTGLPPTPEEVREFVADPSEDAYLAVVDDLLSRPTFGEHFARPWLDVVRFADTNGIHHDHYREVSAYRDWVIRALNDNLPYDQFVVDQVAGDLHPEPTSDQLVASGFHRLHRIIDVGTALPEESYTNNVIDRVTAYSTAFLGLTAHCAVCHDHKYDPISQREFYGLFAFFNGLDGAPETGGRSGGDFRRGLQQPYVEFPDEAQRLALDAAQQELDAVQSAVRTLETMPEAERPEDYGARLDAARKERQRATRARDDLRIGVPAALVMRERAEPRPAFLLRRGDYQQPGEQVSRGTPAFLPPLGEFGGDTIPSRMDLARWTVRTDHPLTARVAVNRVWQILFGTGLVKTSEDFGTQGESPSHPALLDHLAQGFVRSGWDVKGLVRRIVASATYRQDSSAETARFRADPENRLLGRGARYRLDAEVVRDQILAASGLLDRTMFGPSVKIPQPPGLWEAVALPDSYPRVHVADEGAQHRRSVYTFWKRGLPPPQMTILDAPSREACVARRERTNTPLQALLLLNEPEYLAAARHLARTRSGMAGDDAERIRDLYETVTCQVPSPEVQQALLQGVRDLRDYYRAHPTLARDLAADPSLLEADAAELATWTLTVSTLFNLDATRHRS